MRFGEGEMVLKTSIRCAGIAVLSLFGCLPFASWNAASLPPARALFVFPDQARGRQGYMDELGRERIPARYLRAAAFAEGRAIVQLAEEPQSTAFIDGRGTVLCRLNLAFEEVTFSNERVILGGQVLTPAGQALFEVMGPWGGRDEGFAEGLLNVRKDGAYGFVDINGQEVITPRFAKASPFAEGLAAVAEMSTMADNQGYIDRNGEWVIQPKFSWANSFSDGLAQVRGGYIDKKGTLVISTEQLSRRLCRNPSCEVRTNDFADGLALVEVWDDWDESHDRFFGFIDHTGAVAIAPRFGLASSFSEGLAAAAADGPYGYIDKAGRWVVRPKFGEAGPFVNGLARVSAVAGKKDEAGWRPLKVGYVDVRGRWVRSWDELKPPPLPQ
jgi:hypothetical protein